VETKTPPHPSTAVQADQHFAFPPFAFRKSSSLANNPPYHTFVTSQAKTIAASGAVTSNDSTHRQRHSDLLSARDGADNVIVANGGLLCCAQCLSAATTEKQVRFKTHLQSGVRHYMPPQGGGPGKDLVALETLAWFETVAWQHEVAAVVAFHAWVNDKHGPYSGVNKTSYTLNACQELALCPRLFRQSYLICLHLMHLSPYFLMRVLCRWFKKISKINARTQWLLLILDFLLIFSNFYVKAWVKPFNQRRPPNTRPDFPPKCTREALFIDTMVGLSSSGRQAMWLADADAVCDDAASGSRTNLEIEMKDLTILYYFRHRVVCELTNQIRVVKGWLAVNFGCCDVAYTFFTPECHGNALFEHRRHNLIHSFVLSRSNFMFRKNIRWVVIVAWSVAT